MGPGTQITGRNDHSAPIILRKVFSSAVNPKKAYSLINDVHSQGPALSSSSQMESIRRPIRLLTVDPESPKCSGSM